jgi:uncharacterized protein (TIGR01244 family)
MVTARNKLFYRLAVKEKFGIFFCVHEPSPLSALVITAIYPSPVAKRIERKMAAFQRINSCISVAGGLNSQDVAEAAKAGFGTILNLQPDGERAGQMSSADVKSAAERWSLSYEHVPTSKFDVFTDTAVESYRTVLRAADRPVLAICASGQRAAIVWAAAQARDQRPVAEILATLNAAGFDFDFLRDDLDAQADRAHWCSSQAVAPQTDVGADAREPALDLAVA